MTAEEVEVDFGVLVTQIHYAVELKIHIRVMDGEQTFVTLRCYITFDIQVVIRVAVVCQFAHTGIDVSLSCAVVDLTLCGNVQRHRTQPRMV